MGFLDNTFEKSRFVLVPENLIDLYEVGAMVIMTDIAFWHEHWDELHEWCEQYKSSVIGMTIELPDTETLTLFCLRWN